MDDVLLTIGAFARAVDLAPSALRFYDDCGLLVPAEVDTTTGYRYYTPELERRARLIHRMRDVGVPIETMRAVLDGPVHLARPLLGGFLSERSDETVRTAAVVHDVLAQIEASAEARPASAVVDGPELASALRQVRGAAETDPASPLAGVLVELDGSRLDVVATNRYWLACRTLIVPLVSDLRPVARAVLTPSAAFALVRRLDGGAAVAVVLADGGMTVEEAGDSGLSAGGPVETRDTPWPAHRLILDGLEDPGCRVTVDRAELLTGLAAADRAVVLLTVGAAAVDVSTESDGGATLSAVVRGASDDLLVSTSLLSRAVSACVGPEVTFDLRGATRPVTVRSVYQSGFLTLVMPTRREA